MHIHGVQEKNRKDTIGKVGQGKIRSRKEGMGANRAAPVPWGFLNWAPLFFPFYASDELIAIT